MEKGGNLGTHAELAFLTPSLAAAQEEARLGARCAVRKTQAIPSQDQIARQDREGTTNLLDLPNAGSATIHLGGQAFQEAGSSVMIRRSRAWCASQSAQCRWYSQTGQLQQEQPLLSAALPCCNKKRVPFDGPRTHPSKDHGAWFK
jgi:hypothetical protein